MRIKRHDGLIRISILKANWHHGYEVKPSEVDDTIYVNS